MTAAVVLLHELNTKYSESVIINGHNLDMATRGRHVSASRYSPHSGLNSLVGHGINLSFFK